MNKLALLPLLLTLACAEGAADGNSDDDDDGNELSCVSEVAGAPFCAEYTGSSWTEALVQSTVCSDDDQTFSATLCDTTGALFQCDTKVGDPEEQHGYYFAGAVEATAQSHCEGALGGTFVIL